MNNKFDELTKSLAQSITRRAALKKFGVGLAGIALACFGLVKNSEARSTNKCVQWFCQHGGLLPYSVFYCGAGKPPKYLYGNCNENHEVSCGYCTGCC